jgi:hypothetical protein
MLKQWYKELKRRIQSFILWAPVLFSDRWFDSAYLLKIIERKCRYDSYMYFVHGVAQSSGVVSEELKIAAEICHRLQNLDAYYDKYLGPIREDKSKDRWVSDSEFAECLAKGNKDMNDDLSRLAELFKKIHTWSD